MVLLAAAVCTKSGKVIISRQFVEMTRARIEGLLAAFPKLMGVGRQHTFVETESVRYVYQPLEKLYMLLITTKASNILEDLETLRLFSRVIPEYCKNMDEPDIVNNSFNLISAFDEIVALGYRENVNLAQIRTFVEMDSHEEKVYQAVRQTQEKEAKQKMKEKARELQKARHEATRKGRSPGFGPGGYGSSGGQSYAAPNVGDTAPTVAEAPAKPAYTPSARPSGSNKALKLGSKNKDVDTFVDMLKSEGENVVSPAASSKQTSNKAAPQVALESVNLRCEEKATIIAKRHGGIENMELHGLVTLNITDEKFDRIRIQLDDLDDSRFQMVTHPNIDKEAFKNSSIIGLKNPSKSFPLNTDVGVLKWRFQTQDESVIPLLINCWPSDDGNGGCDVNIEYTLQQEHMELNEVEISIPVPSGCNPVVSECEGMYEHDSRKNFLRWRLPVIDADNENGTLEFQCGGRSADFFPVLVDFVSKSTFCKIKVDSVTMVDTDEAVKYSLDTTFVPEKYEIV